jgi:hypothetical protein
VGSFPIKEFSWLRPSRAELRDPTVADVVRAAHERGPNPFVVYDPVRRFAAVVLPDAALEAVEQRHFSPSESAHDCGLMAILSDGQVRVDAESPAVDVVRTAIATETSVVIAVGQNEEPVGVFVPSNAAARLHETLRNNGYDPSTWFSPAWQDEDPTRAPDDGLVSAIDAISRGELGRYETTFHSENLNYRSPVMGVCPDHGRSHYTYLPCPQHGSMQGMARRFELR